MSSVPRQQAEHHGARSAAAQALVMSSLDRLLDAGEPFFELSIQRTSRRRVSPSTTLAPARGRCALQVCSTPAAKAAQ
ncbi:hypothetical protein ABZ468_10910 [Streptomyces sp. NPDC005708]|uniref:hypothetical protein n=1 Tax=Streptomyces sp. NPDC005708 TaxID=3154564 RepID=UPI00340C9CD5